MHLIRTKPDANLHRFYRMEVVQGLFGNWVGIGSSDQVRTNWFETQPQAKNARFELHMAKAKRSYG